MQFYRKGIAAAGLVLLSALAVAQKPATPPEPAKPLSAEALSRDVVVRTNAERAAKGLPPLKLNPSLRKAARWLAQDMAEKNYFDHVDSENRRIDRRLPDNGYTDYQTIGENIAAGQKSPADVVAGWMKSEGHRRNLLGDEFREIGVGYFYKKDNRYRRLWVQNFGTRRDRYPVIINAEAPETEKSDVTLYVYGKEWAKEMRFSNDGETWSKWEPYQAERKWTLAEGAGEKTVTVELRNGGKTRRAEDSIEVVPKDSLAKP